MIDLNINLIKDPILRRNMSSLKDSLEYVPVGTIMQFATSATKEEIQNGDRKMPDRYLLADGSSLRRNSFKALFAIIGTTYGEGDSATETFALPDITMTTTIYGVKYK